MSDEGKYTLETTRADKSVWLMKCPPVVTRSWQAASAASGSSGSGDPTQNPIVAKVVLSLDLLNPDESSAMQFKMEMAQTDSGHTPKSYSLNMFKDFVPMTIFSESNQGLSI
ncbi:uncharacterized protein LOC144561891 [Carex rostrata]|jgi:transcription initiation factor TFIIF subunit beta